LLFEEAEKKFIMSSFVYILANKRNGTLYTGVTSDLIKRIYQHKSNLVEGFSKKYGTHNLVYYEIYDEITDAVAREKCIKKWRRQWKLDLIERINPQWNDLYESIL
jgi:putative endonuclease